MSSTPRDLGRVCAVSASVVAFRCGGGVGFGGEDADSALGQQFPAHVAAAFRPFVALLGQRGPDEADQGVAAGEDPDDVPRPGVSRRIPDGRSGSGRRPPARRPRATGATRQGGDARRRTRFARPLRRPHRRGDLGPPRPRQAGNVQAGDELPLGRDSEVSSGSSYAGSRAPRSPCAMRGAVAVSSENGGNARRLAHEPTPKPNAALATTPTSSTELPGASRPPRAEPSLL